MKKHTAKLFELVLLEIILIFVIPVTLYSQDHHDWSYNLSIYEVNVRQYTGAGTFGAFETHLDRLRDLGVGILWFMPIHPIGVKNRIGSLGSYYSVKDYYGVNPEFGTPDDFIALVDSVHAKGMYVLMDWVANHTSWDNALTITHPEWYIKDNEGNFTPPPGTDWSDVIQLDYSKQGLRDYMINAMKFWIDTADVDGFRCDAAGFVPIDFWSEAITELKNDKLGIFMLAEDSGTQYYSAGFDMTYAWGYYGFGNGILMNIVAGTNNANVLNSFVTQENSSYPAPDYRMYFTSNHDENSWYGTVFERFGDAVEEFAVLTSTFRSMPLIYSGQEAGLNHRLEFFDKDEIIWKPDTLAYIYSTLLHLKRENKALWNGSAGGPLQRVTTTDNASVFALIREKDNDKVFEVFNLTDQEKTFTFNGTSYTGKYRDVFTSDSVSFNENAEMTLSPWSYEVYEYVSGITGVTDEKPVPEQFALSQNYPNPFNPSTTIEYQISEAGFVSLKLYDVLGNEIETLVNKQQLSGKYEITFNAENLVSGVYLYKIQINDFVSSKKMLLLK
ncbi:MAG: alpha-amylase family glycosyl hydrolase [Ignavibacteriaceae bacterium]